MSGGVPVPPEPGSPKILPAADPPPDPGIGRDFYLMWGGQTLSMAGDQFGGMALSILILQYTGSAFAMSMNVVASILPAILFGPVAGLLLDRTDRKRLLVLIDAIRGVLTLAFGLVILAGRFSLAYSYGWSLTNSFLRSFYDPGTMAIIPALVPPGRLPRANALQATGRNIAGIVGPALAGVVVARYGPWYALVANAVSYEMSALGIGLAHTRYEERSVKAEGRPKLLELKEGFDFFRTTRLALTLLVTTIVVNACSQPAGIALSVHIVKTLGESPALLGVIGSVSAGASLLSSVVVAARKRMSRMGKMMAFAIMGNGVAYFLVSVTKTATLIPVAYALAGLMGPILQVAVQTLYQDITPSYIRGRVFALRVALSQALSPITFAVAGALLDLFGSRAIFAGIGIILLSAGLVIGSRKEVREV